MQQDIDITCNVDIRKIPGRWVYGGSSGQMNRWTRIWRCREVYFYAQAQRNRSSEHHCPYVCLLSEQIAREEEREEEIEEEGKDKGRQKSRLMYISDICMDLETIKQTEERERKSEKEREKERD